MQIEINFADEPYLYLYTEDGGGYRLNFEWKTLYTSRTTQEVPGHSSGPPEPGSSPGHVMWDLWRTKWHCGRFSRSISVSSANSHSTDCSTLTINQHPGLVQLGQLVADVPNELSLNPPQEKKMEVP
jgi:hypothetical protein